MAVHAAGVNPVDAGNRADGSWAGLRAPCILGYDIAGVIDSVGPGVSGLAPGDRVMAMTHFPDGAGGYAELAVIDAGLTAAIPRTVSFADAAATPLAAGTAQVVLSRLGLSAGGQLLVLGGSGGVGLFLLQLAAAAGIVTFAVGRRDRHDRWPVSAPPGASTTPVRMSRTAPWRWRAAGGCRRRSGRRRADSYRPGGPEAGGQIASIATPELDLDPLLDANITFHGVLIQDDGERTRALARRLAGGALRPVISHVLPLAAADQAHRILDGGHAGGKIVLDVAGS